MSARLLATTLLIATKGAADDQCTSPTVKALLALFKATDVEDLAQTLLLAEQAKCASNGCPKVDLDGCSNQSVDDVQCAIPNVFSTSVKLGTDAICDAGCNDWPCVAGCDGLDTGICYAGDYVLCKAGCLGIKSCVHKCEHAIVDPCKDKLIHKCKDKCEAAFQDCKSKCKEQLTMQVSADFQHIGKVLTSASILSLEANCSGNGITDLLNMSALAMVHFDEIQVDLKLHLKDVGISSDNDLSLKKIRMTVRAPVEGSLHCGLLKRNVELRLGDMQISEVDLDADLKLDSAIGTIASVVCVGLPFCKDAIKDTIAKAIKEEIVKEVPAQLVKVASPLLQGVMDAAHCPSIFGEGPQLV